MAERPFGFGSLVEKQSNAAYGLDYFSRFKDHVSQLDIQARGKVLVIGPGVQLEEVALIEPQVVEGIVSAIQVLGANPFATVNLQEAWLIDHPKVLLAVDSSSYGHFFDARPGITFDTILFIGAPLYKPLDTFKELASHLNPAGKLFLTVNGRVPTEPIDAAGCVMKILPKIQANPNYDMAPGYYGVIIQKSLH